MKTMRLRHVATVTPSNVDKVVEADEIPVRLCNYIDVYKYCVIHGDLDLSNGSATKLEIEKFRLRAGDVLITKDSEDPSDIAVPAYVEADLDDVVCGYHLAMLRPDPRRITGKYLFWALLAKPVRDAFSNEALGITRFGLSIGDIKSVPIPLPDLATQKAIATFLDAETARIDALIEKKERQAERLEEKRRAEKAFLTTRGLNPDVEMGPVELPMIPSAPTHWRVRRLARVFRESSEMGGDGLPVLSVSINWGISDRELDDEDRHRVVNHIEDRSAYKRVRIGDLVYNMMRAWQGAFGVARVDGLVSPAYVVARPIEALHAPYLEPLLRTPMWIEEFRRASRGIADFRQRLYWEHFRQVVVLLPPLDEQKMIADEIERRDSIIETVLAPLRASIDRLREFRSALITAAVTGQIDPADWRRRGEGDRTLERIEAEMAS